MQLVSKTKLKCNFHRSVSAVFGGKATHVNHHQESIDIGNMHLLDLAKEVKKGIEETGRANPFIFNTIGISDAISMGTDGMRSSLPSRDIIADSIECVMRGQLYDANISLVHSFLVSLTVAWM
jgi:dihydroxyacid dehydratase/phosphogluconate dehydratase